MSTKGYAIITGAARGIGRAIFLELAGEGYDVVGTYTSAGSDGKMQALVDQVQKDYGVKAISVRSDVGTLEGCQTIVDSAVRAFGRDLAVLVNNAGVAGTRFFKDEDPDNIARTIQVDLVGAINLCSLVLPCMVERKGGDIISMSSVAPLTGIPSQSVYSAAKYGLVGFSKCLAKEVAAYNIKVNCIAPGAIATDMVAESVAEQRAAVEATIPMGRMSAPEEIALCVSYILKSTYLTGQTISPNGGVVSIP